MILVYRRDKRRSEGGFQYHIGTLDSKNESSQTLESQFFLGLEVGLFYPVVTDKIDVFGSLYVASHLEVVGRRGVWFLGMWIVLWMRTSNELHYITAMSISIFHRDN